MYLSRVTLDAANRRVMEGLVRPSLFHGAVERSVGDEQGRSLWRIDQFKGNYCMLLVTRNLPNLTVIADQFGLQGAQCEAKNYDPFLNSIQKDQHWRFRVKLNPVRCVNAKRCPVMNRDLKTWFVQRAEANGFEVAPEGFDIAELRDYCFSKNAEAYNSNSAMVRFKSATFEGILKVSNIESLKQALCSGIGKDKAYGCGLLTLVRA